MSKNDKTLKNWHLIALGAVLLVGLGLKLYSYRLETVTVHLNNQDYTVLVAKNYAQQYRGWSKRKDMGKTDGMLFLFRNRSQHAMVMRDMLFPLDIIWVDDKTIVDMAPGVPAEPGKTEEQLIPYFARGPSTIVLEMASGTIFKAGFKIGDKIEVVK